jgi:hypothetical protein
MVSYIFDQDRAFSTRPVTMTNGGNKASRIDLHEILRLLVRVDLDVLVRQVFCLQCDPGTLGKWTEMKVSVELW